MMQDSSVASPPQQSVAGIALLHCEDEQVHHWQSQWKMREGSYFTNGSGANYGYDGDGEMQIGQVDGDAEMAKLQMLTVDRVDESLVQRVVENPVLVKIVVWTGGFETQELVAQSVSVSVRDATHQIDEKVMRTSMFEFETEELRVVEKNESVSANDNHLASGDVAELQGASSNFAHDRATDSSPP